MRAAIPSSTKQKFLSYSDDETGNFTSSWEVYIPDVLKDSSSPGGIHVVRIYDTVV